MNCPCFDLVEIIFTVRLILDYLNIELLKCDNKCLLQLHYSNYILNISCLRFSRIAKTDDYAIYKLFVKFSVQNTGIIDFSFFRYKLMVVEL